MVFNVIFFESGAVEQTVHVGRDFMGGSQEVVVESSEFYSTLLWQGEILILL